VLEVKTDREIAPLPPHISLEQARKFIASAAQEKGAGHIIGDTARQVFNAVFERAD
jgi:pyruvate dehydrogenase (quinone)